MTKLTESEVREFEAILQHRLHVFEAYHSGTRSADSSRAKRFLEVLAGRELPRTKNEKAYLYYLRKVGRPVIHVGHSLPEHMKSKPWETNKKWDDAADNMSGWKSWNT